jgi:hypothetical protein
MYITVLQYLTDLHLVRQLNPVIPKDTLAGHGPNRQAG